MFNSTFSQNRALWGVVWLSMPTTLYKPLPERYIIHSAPYTTSTTTILTGSSTNTITLHTAFSVQPCTSTSTGRKQTVGLKLVAQVSMTFPATRELSPLCEGNL